MSTVALIVGVTVEQNMTTFVLVHGAWHDGSCWDAVIWRLVGQGHAVHAPTIAGHGIGVDKQVDHSQCVASVVEYIVERDLKNFVLVGHSFGGTVIAQVAADMPQRVRRLVFWNAFVPENGNSLLDEVPVHYAEMFSRLAAASTDNTVAMPFDMWREVFINDADMALARESYEEKVSPEPFAPFAEKLDLTRFYQLDIPRSYLNCTDDNVMPAGEWGWLTRFRARLGICRLVQMPGSHEAMFSSPELLAQKIVEAGRD